MLGTRMQFRVSTVLLFGVASVFPSLAAAQDGRSISTTGACSPIVIDAGGNVTNNINCPITLSEAQLAQLREAIAQAARTQAGLTGPLVERLETLSGELRVRKSALENFFRILKQNNVELGDLDSALRQIATRHLELTQRLAKSAETEEPEIRETLAKAKAAIEQGDYDRADGLLAQAEELDLRAIARQQEELDARRLRAAETRAERGELSLIKFDYLEAAQHFVGAARIVPSNHLLVVARYANMAGSAFYDGAAYAGAEEQYNRSLSLRERNLEPDDAEIALALNNLATVYYSTGRYAEAERLFQRALAINEAAIGPDHPDVAIRRNNLARIYHDTGRYAEAKPLYQRALAINEAALGPDHPDVAVVLHNLADLYRTTGRYAEAEPLYQRALAIDEAALGSDHPDVAIDLNSLATLYADTGRYAEAEPLYQRALAIGEATLGPEHPEVATSLSNLATLYADTGRYAEAELLLERALAIDEAAFGPNHPNVAHDLGNLAGLYHDTGRSPEAEPLFRRALKIFETSLGSDHPKTRIVRANLQRLQSGN